MSQQLTSLILLKLRRRLRREHLPGPGLALERSSHPGTQLHRLRGVFHRGLRQQSAFPAFHGAGERSAGVLCCGRWATGGQLHPAGPQTGGGHVLSRRRSLSGDHRLGALWGTWEESTEKLYLCIMYETRAQPTCGIELGSEITCLLLREKIKSYK